MSRLRLLKRTIPLAMATSLIAAAAIGPVPALAACNPGRQNSTFNGFAGTIGAPSPYPYGIKAKIYEYDPYVASGGNSGAWVMLNLTSERYAQIGWWKDSSAGRKVFAQYTDICGHSYTDVWAGQTPGSTHNCRMSYSGSANEFHFYKDGNLLLVEVEYWLPNEYEMMGETHRLDDQMPGGVNSHEAFTSTYYQNTSIGWTSMSSSANPNNPAYGAKRVSSVRYEVWDTACSN